MKGERSYHWKILLFIPLVAALLCVGATTPRVSACSPPLLETVRTPTITVAEEHILRYGEFRSAESVADLIFQGQVLKIDVIDQSPGSPFYVQRVRFAVDRVWKGDAPTEVVVTRETRTAPSLVSTPSIADSCATSIAAYINAHRPTPVVQSDDEFVSGTYVVFAGKTLRPEFEAFRFRKVEVSQFTLMFLGPGYPPNASLSLPVTTVPPTATPSPLQPIAAVISPVATPVATALVAPAAAQAQPESTSVQPFVLIGIAIAAGIALAALVMGRQTLR